MYRCQHNREKTEQLHLWPCL